MCEDLCVDQNVDMRKHMCVDMCEGTFVRAYMQQVVGAGITSSSVSRTVHDSMYTMGLESVVSFDRSLKYIGGHRSYGSRHGAEMCVNMYIDMRLDMCADIYVDLCAYICADMCADMCAGMCADRCVDMCEAVFSVWQECDRAGVTCRDIVYFGRTGTYMSTHMSTHVYTRVYT